MRIKKIRGHRRRWKSIDAWVKHEKQYGLDYLSQSKRNYTKIYVHPWSSITLTNSIIPTPKRETKRRILTGLLDIHDHWKMKLDALGEPYKLKIWLYEPHFSKSQVVCAIGDDIDFYQNSFNKGDDKKILNAVTYGKLASRLKGFNWEHCLDEDFLFPSDLGNPREYLSMEEFEAEKRWYERKLTKPHQVYVSKSDGQEIYIFNKGDVWVGEKH